MKQKILDFLNSHTDIDSIMADINKMAECPSTGCADIHCPNCFMSYVRSEFSVDCVRMIKIIVSEKSNSTQRDINNMAKELLRLINAEYWRV